MKKLLHSFYLSTSLILLFSQVLNVKTLVAQSGDCEQIRVGVYYEQIVDSDEAFDLLNKNYGSKSNEEWINELDQKFLEALRANSPEIDFFSGRQNPGKDPHYRLRYWLHIIAQETDLLIPSYANTYEDPITGWIVTEYTDPVFRLETGFLMGAFIWINSPCVPNMCYGVAASMQQDMELDGVISKISQSLWRIKNIIDESERKRPVPARGPELEIDNEKDYLSLLTEEDRRMEVIAKVKNCKGEYLKMDRSVLSQPVKFPKDVRRCRYKRSSDCWQHTYPEFDIVFTNKQYEAKGIYIVKEGIEASVEKVPLETCGIGSTSITQKDGELTIRGLEIEVKPDRREIYVDEGTEITIKLNETDPDGSKYPVKDREIEFFTEGVVNGKITPQGPYTTDKNGEVTLTYRAGDNDSRIDMTARFQPPGYPDKAEDHSSIKVNPAKYEATLFLKKKVIKRTVSHNEKHQSGGICTTDEKDDLKISEEKEASVYVTLKSLGSIDMYAFNQRWETYQVTSTQLSKFDLYYNERDYLYSNSTGPECAGGGIEQITTRKKTLTDRQLLSPAKGSTLIVAFDKESDKAVLILPFGAGVDYTFDTESKMKVTTWDKYGNKKERESDATETDQTEEVFSVAAVEDEQPLSTVMSKSQQLQDYISKVTGEEVKLDIVDLVPKSQQGPSNEKIHPDLVVQFGDGINYFGGRGKKVIDKEIYGGYEHEEQTFMWQMTRKKEK
ncbi:MAG: hypothetical protein ACQERS_01040 [Bacteroidota bacterium]